MWWNRWPCSLRRLETWSRFSPSCGASLATAEMPSRRKPPPFSKSTRHPPKRAASRTGAGRLSQGEPQLCRRHRTIDMPRRHGVHCPDAKAPDFDDSLLDALESALDWSIPYQLWLLHLEVSITVFSSCSSWRNADNCRNGLKSSINSAKR